MSGIHKAEQSAEPLFLSGIDCAERVSAVLLGGSAFFWDELKHGPPHSKHERGQQNLSTPPGESNGGSQDFVPSKVSPLVSEHIRSEAQLDSSS